MLRMVKGRIGSDDSEELFLGSDTRCNASKQLTDSPHPLDILRWQKADGSFEPCAELLEFIGLGDDEAQSILDDNPDRARVRTTRATLEWIRTVDDENRQILVGSIGKAVDWLKKNDK